MDGATPPGMYSVPFPMATVPFPESGSLNVTAPPFGLNVSVAFLVISAARFACSAGEAISSNIPYSQSPSVIITGVPYALSVSGTPGADAVTVGHCAGRLTVKLPPKERMES